MSVSEKIVFIIGVMMMAFGVPLFLIGIVGGYYHPPKDGLGDAIGITLVFGALQAGAGYWLCRFTRSRARRRTLQDVEHKIMQYARTCEGK